MRILQINKFFYRRGGADHHFFDLSDLLKSKGEEVIHFSMKHPDNLSSPYEKFFVSEVNFEKTTVDSVLKSGRVFYSAEANKKLDRLIKETKPDIAHAHLVYHQLPPSLLEVLKRNNVPVVMTIHDWKPICPNYLLYTEGRPCARCKDKKYYHCLQYKCVEDSYAKSFLASMESYFHHAKRYYEDCVDMYVAPSRFVKEMFLSFGWKESKIKVLPHFLPDSFSRVSVPPANPVLASFAYIGRLSKEKGADRLVKYWAKKRVNHQLDVYGSGPLENDLARFLEKNKIQNIRLMGRAARESINFSKYTAIIIPSEFYETFGLVAIESWARGVPIIARDSGGLAELMESSKAGLAFDWENDSLAKALDEIRDERFRQNAVSYMRSSHRPDDYYEKIMSVYRQIAA